MCIRMIKGHFGRVWIYHKGYKRYAARVAWKRLSLDDPESKTRTVVVVAGAVALLVIGSLLMAASSKRG